MGKILLTNCMKWNDELRKIFAKNGFIKNGGGGENSYIYQLTRS